MTIIFPGVNRWVALIGLCTIISIIVMIVLLKDMTHACNQNKTTCVLYALDDNRCGLTIDTMNKTITCNSFKCDLKENDQTDVDCYYYSNFKCPTLECYDKFTVGYTICIIFLILAELCLIIVYRVYIWCYIHNKCSKYCYNDEESKFKPTPRKMHRDTIFAEH